MRRRSVAVAALVSAGVSLAGGALLGSCSRRAEPPVLWTVPEFALVDQVGDTLRTRDLRGRVWIAGFVFTHCTDACPLISARMASVRDSLGTWGLLGSRARLVSVTVDPERDTPEILREYAGRFGGSPPSEWAFLTGGSGDEIRRMVQEGFRLAAMLEPAARAGLPTSYQVAHSPRLALVDEEGRVRGTYDATDSEAWGRLLRDLGTLLGRP